MAELAEAAEKAGWDGVFYCDAIAIGAMELFDPWVVMAAIAMRTHRVTIGSLVTPPARRRPWKLARETMTLDRLSGGRLVLPVGLGTTDDAGFGAVGEPVKPRVRAELLDESLDILEGLWSGRPFAYLGAHFSFPEMTFLPTPVQRPRIPIWVVGTWPVERSVRRTLRWDGIVAQVRSAASAELSPEHIRGIVELAARERSADQGPFDVIVQGLTGADERDPAAIVSPWAEAGATWWIEADWEHASVDGLRRRIEAGPPRI